MALRGAVESGERTPRSARVTGHREPVQLQHLGDLARGPTWPVEDLPVGEPDCRSAVDGGVEIPFEVGIAPGRCGRA
ncbi:hypothetical protein [Mycolicibacterium conceptionense]|uniref:hypothetical protein n=1 Tax=Mycolicibacterium conceptionense TaxID=451644 RepID=UPI0013FD6F66